MDTDGDFAPETAAAAREQYGDAGRTAQVVVKEVAKAMAFDEREYSERVTSDVVETARDVLFASRLAVHVGTREEFEQWCADHPEYDVEEIGSEHVDGVAWHAAPFAERVVAATFHEKRRAAVETLRRQAFGRLYRDVVATGESDGDRAAGESSADADTTDDGTADGA